MKLNYYKKHRGRRSRFELQEILLEHHPNYTFGEDVQFLTYRDALSEVQELERKEE